jgi:hypothetical protein
MPKTGLAISIFILLIPFAAQAQTGAVANQNHAAVSPFEVLWQFDTGG